MPSFQRDRVRQKLGESLAAMDVTVTRLAHAVATLAVWPVLYAAALGTGICVIAHKAWIPQLDTNKLPKPDTYKLAIAGGIAAGSLAIVYGVSVLVARLYAKRRGNLPPSVGTVVGEMHRRLRFLLAIPLLPALTLNNIERDSPKETYFLIVLIGAITTAAVYAWRKPPPPLLTTIEQDDAPPSPGREQLKTGLALTAVFALWGGYTLFFRHFSITNHHALHTATLDLGLYDNIFYQSAHGHPLGCSFVKGGSHGSAHFDPILILLSPLYLLDPRAEFLLTLQSLWLGAGVLPVYLLAQHRLGSRLSGVAFAAMYAIYPAVHGANMYDFHSLALITPMAVFLVYFLETGHIKAYWALLPLMLLVREDIAILLCFVGAYAILSRKPGWARIGWVTIAVSFVYFAVAKRFFMNSADVLNSGDNSYSFAYYYEDLIPNHNGAAGLFISILTNPVFLLKTALAEAKILYLLALFAPLAFLPFLARPGRIMLGWGLFFSLLASRTAVFSTHFQYSCLIIPIAFAIAPQGLKQVEEGPFLRMRGIDGARFGKALLAGAFVTSLLVSWKFGGLLENATFHGGFGPAARTLSAKERDTYEWLRGEIAKIPPDASVGATNHVGAHISNRLKAYHYHEHMDAEWLVLDESELHGGTLDKHTKAAKDGVIELVSKHDHLAVYKRRGRGR